MRIIKITKKNNAITTMLPYSEHDDKNISPTVKYLIPFDHPLLPIAR